MVFRCVVVMISGLPRPHSVEANKLNQWCLILVCTPVGGHEVPLTASVVASYLSVLDYEIITSFSLTP